LNKEVAASVSGVIEARGITKLFGDRYALRGIDLTVNRGEHVVIFGPNGAGKTTLLKVLSTLVKPTAGSVWLDGVDIRDKPVQIRRRISLVGHQTFLYDDLTVYENLKFYGRMYGIPDLEAKILEVISVVQLEPRLHDRVGTLSHGMQQRASMARAVLHNPSILFLDEPEIGLDPHASAIVRDILGDDTSGSRTAVMATHNLERGLELGDRFVILDRGKTVYQASRDELAEVNLQQIYDRYTGTGK
jgi:heme exporter protein A